MGCDYFFYKIRFASAVLTTYTEGEILGYLSIFLFRLIVNFLLSCFKALFSSIFSIIVFCTTFLAFTATSLAPGSRRALKRAIRFDILR
jgi:hypothetical protein